MKKRVKKDVQLNIPVDVGVARQLRILAAHQDKTRSQFMRDIFEMVAVLGSEVRQEDAFVVEVRVVQELGEEVE